ncbi:MAG: response regulator transcription factor [Chromatiales bacterium]|nr:response regulator transcription factor [Chromatiales bacterium]
MHILVVEDDPSLGDALVAVLSAEGHAVELARRAAEAEQILAAARVDAMLLDINLPDASGFEVLATLRKAHSEIPVLVVTARDAVDDRIKGLDLGADDYLVKPFHVGELAARIRALERRHARGQRAALVHGPIRIDPAARSVTLHGQRVALAERELTLLELLLTHRGQVVTRAAIENHLYGWNDTVESNTVEVYVHSLRRRFGHELIRTVRGIGYVVDVDAPTA